MKMKFLFQDTLFPGRHFGFLCNLHNPGTPRGGMFLCNMLKIVEFVKMY